MDDAPLAFLAGVGEVATLMRAHDWIKSPLGAPVQWPASLKAVVRIMLTTRHPVFVFWGPDQLSFYNDAYARSIGPEKHPAMLGRPGKEYWQEIWPIIGPQIEFVMQGKGATWHENQLVPIVRNGTIEDVYWTYSYSPIDDADAPAGIGGVLVICAETTSIIRSEAQLRASEQSYRTMAESLPQLVWTCDPDGRCNYLSRQWVEYTGQPQEYQLGLEWLNRVIHPDDRPRTYDHWMGAVAGRHPYDIDYRIRRHDGEYRWFKTRGTPIRDDQGGITYWFGTCTDISDVIEAREVLARSEAELDKLVQERTIQLEMAQDALRQSQKLEAIGQLTGGVAHDFNNLLMPIIGNLDLLQRFGVGGEREQRLIAGALTSAERAKTLVQRLLAFARRQPLQPKPVDVAVMVREMTELVRSTLGPRIKLALDIAAELPPAMTDANQLEMALLNLTVNARDAMPDGGQLTISAQSEVVVRDGWQDLAKGVYVTLIVSDTGLGMDQATIARAIEPFFSTKGVGKGTGLGLSMVHGLASQLGGALKISSRPGVGTTVVLWLPVSSRPVVAESPPAVGNDLCGDVQTILLVDDDALVRSSTAAMLGNLGYRVIEASGGQEAMRLFDDGIQFDILLSDYAMPGMTGEDLAGALSFRRPAARVLIMSGFADEKSVSAHLPRLVKPFRIDDLARGLAGLN